MTTPQSVTTLTALAATTAVCALLALTALTPDDARAGGAAADDVASLLQTQCGKCHGERRTSAGLDLTVAPATLVGRASTQNPSLDLITPGKPDASYLFLKVTDRHAAGGQGARMPLGADPLPASAVDTLRAWISAGAR